MADTLIVSNGATVSMDYVLTVDGAVMDASQPGQPLKFVQGKGQIIPGLEKELLGMAVGESKEVTVDPALGYGLVNPTAFTSIPRSRVPPSLPLELNLQVQLSGADGRPLVARIAEITPEEVRLDFNHPLAGKTLYFKVTIAAVSA